MVPGGKPIIFFPMLALLEPGDEVIYPNPGFPIYESMINFLGAKPVPMPLEESRGFSFDLNLFRDRLSDRTKMVDPQFAAESDGRRDPAATISRAIAEMLRERDVIVLSDEIYSRIYYGERGAGVDREFPGMLEKTIILDGFSKTYAMTGWRMGYGVMPDLDRGRGEQADGEFELLHGELYAAGGDRGADRPAGLRRADGRRVPAAAGRDLQRAEPGARLPLRGSRAARSMRSPMSRRRDRLEGTGGSFAVRGRRVVPERRRFGEYGDGYIRFSYANSLANLEEAVARIQKVAHRWASAAVR